MWRSATSVTTLYESSTITWAMSTCKKPRGEGRGVGDFALVGGGGVWAGRSSQHTARDNLRNKNGKKRVVARAHRRCADEHQ
eukprot:3781262-Prymnesium_polylepis.1